MAHKAVDLAVSETSGECGIDRGDSVGIASQFEELGKL